MVAITRTAQTKFTVLGQSTNILISPSYFESKLDFLKISKLRYYALFVNRKSKAGVEMSPGVWRIDNRSRIRFTGQHTWNLHSLKLYVAVGRLHGFQDPLEVFVSDAAE